VAAVDLRESCAPFTSTSTTFTQLSGAWTIAWVERALPVLRSYLGRFVPARVSYLVHRSVRLIPLLLLSDACSCGFWHDQIVSTVAQDSFHRHGLLFPSS
jgi:hypothetical protein